MTALRDLSIRSKLTAIILASTVLSLGLAFAIVVRNDVHTFRADMVETTRLVARVIGDYSVGDLAFGDRTESAQTLAMLGSIPSVREARLHDAQGTLFSSYTREGQERAGDPPQHPGEFRDGLLHVAQDISYKGVPYGTLHLYASAAELDDKIRRHLTTMVMVAVLLIGLAWIVALRLQRVISRPILDLAATARQISEQHDYSVRVKPAGRDEIGVLCDGFNDMLATIEQRQREREQADQRTREKSQFLANMSHELRTPLNSILGFSEILIERLQERTTPREQKFLQNIHSSGQHLLGIINDILDLSKVEAGKMEVHPERVSVGGTIDAVCTVMKGISSKRRVTFELDVPPGLPVIEADAVKLKQVLYNLATNAVKFSPEGGEVRIVARHLDADGSPLGRESVEISVVDHGVGIHASEHDAVFMEFRQAATDKPRPVEGTGLGLALVKRFVELHDGAVRLESAPGEGSTFTVTFPRYFRGEQPVAAVPGTSTQGTRILVVEDEPAAYRQVSQQLAAAGYVPVWARSGEEAVSLARGLRPAAITLDVMLEDTDGWDVLKKLKSEPGTRNIPVVMVSLLANQELGVALGAADYFLKPVDDDALVRRLIALAPPDTSARVLIVDDDPAVHEMLERRLQSHGFRLAHALSGEEALASAAASPPRVVVLDLMMDGMDGFEAAVRLKADPRTRDAHIVLLSSKDLTAEDRSRLRGTISARVHKGAPEGELAAVIASLIPASPVPPVPPPLA